MGRPHLKDHLWARLVDPISKAELAPNNEVTSDLLRADTF